MADDAGLRDKMIKDRGEGSGLSSSYHFHSFALSSDDCSQLFSKLRYVFTYDFPNESEIYALIVMHYSVS